MNKRKVIVKLLDKCSKDPNNPGVYKRSGVPREVFEKFLAMEMLDDRGLPKESYWLSKDALKYLDYCIQDSFISSEPNLKVTSKGERFMRWWYPIYWFLGLWPIKNIVIPILAALLLTYGALRGAALLGYQVESFTLFGVVITNRPSFEFEFNEQFNSFVVKKNPKITIRSVSWSMATSEGPWAYQQGSNPNSTILEITDVKWALVEELKNAGHLGSESQIKSIVDCHFIPLLEDAGIPVVIQVEYSHLNDSETRSLLYVGRIFGLYKGPPDIQVYRSNVSPEEWRELRKEGREYVASVAQAVVQSGSVLDKNGKCRISFGNRPW